MTLRGLLEILLHLVKRQGIQRSGVKQFCLIFLHFVGYKTGHVRPHTPGVSMYSLTAERLSAKVKNSCNLFPPGAASAASGRPRVGPPPRPPVPPVGIGSRKNDDIGKSRAELDREMAPRCFPVAGVLSSFAESAIKTQYTQTSSSLATSTNNPRSLVLNPSST